MGSQDRASCWSVTINNPTQVDQEQIALARQRGWKVEGQLETGTEGTPHYQLIVRTPQIRFSAVKKAFPRAHIEVARNPAALSSYVVKEQTRTGELPVSQDQYPSLSRYWEMVMRELDDADAIDWNYLINVREERPDIVWWKNAPRGWSRDPLMALDYATERLIEEGYHVESIASNPSTRASWKKFHAAILVRAYRQTDRQTDTCVQNGREEVTTLDIPTTDADETPCPQAPSRVLVEELDQDQGQAQDDQAE